MCERSLRVISERQMRHVIPSAINRLLQYSIFFNYTRFNHLDECIFRFRAAKMKKKKKTATEPTDAHSTLPSVQRCTCLNITDYYETKWVKKKEEKKFKFGNNKNILHERTAPNKWTFNIWFFAFFFNCSWNVFEEHAAFEVFTDLQPQNPCQYVTHVN